MGFNALIHHHRPDLIDFAKLNQSDNQYNLSNAFNIAEKHLGITSLLDPDDMSKTDEMSGLGSWDSMTTFPSVDK